MLSNIEMRPVSARIVMPRRGVLKFAIKVGERAVAAEFVRDQLARASGQPSVVGNRWDWPAPIENEHGPVEICRSWLFIHMPHPPIHVLNLRLPRVTWARYRKIPNEKHLEGLS